jgi:hypothetical protein
MGDWKYSCTTNFGTRLRQVASLTPLPLYPVETTTNIRHVGGYVGPIAGLDVMDGRKISRLYPETSHNSMIDQPIA